MDASIALDGTAIPSNGGRFRATGVPPAVPPDPL